MKMVNRPIDIKPKSILFLNPPDEKEEMVQIKLEFYSFLSRNYNHLMGPDYTYIMINAWNVDSTRVIPPTQIILLARKGEHIFTGSHLRLHIEWTSSLWSSSKSRISNQD